MQRFERLEFVVDSAIARITLNRPDAANAMNFALVRELARAALICDNDKSVKVVLLTGSGRMFSAGGDLKAFSGFGEETGTKLKELADELHKAISLFSRMSAGPPSTGLRPAPDSASRSQETTFWLPRRRSSRWPTPAPA
jgi:2-(1,2-epoxy-1,2-dihydrophenyl)acetyl-CoA isomerase